MKTCILYIATLLVAFALPVTAQIRGPETKAAPDTPAMPYRLSTTLTGNKHGSVTISATRPDGTTGIFILLASDSLVYGAEAGSNQATVKLAITPDVGYVLRASYPKVYLTGDATKAPVGNLTPGADNNGSKIRTFSMPGAPSTVELAYAMPIDTVTYITLKTKVTTADEVLPLLPDHIEVALANGDKYSLGVAATNGWSFTASGNTGNGTAIYDAKPGAVNRFTATLAPNVVPDSIDYGTALTAAGNTCTAIVRVVNQAEALKPDAPGKDLIISNGTGDNLNGGVDGEDIPFNGTIENTEVKSLEVDSTVKNVTITLKDVTVSGGDKPEEAKTEVKPGANLTLRLEGNNTLGTLTVNSGASLVLDKADDATLKMTTISNSGIFRDSTATVKAVVGGTCQLSINELTGGGSVTPDTKVLLIASCTDKAGITSFIWQKRNADGSYTVIQTKNYDANGTLVETKSSIAFEGIKDSFEPVTSATGSTEYRCLIERTVTTTEGGGNEATATTLLSTHPAQVEVKSGGDPVIPTTYYIVTLPVLEGFTSNPAPGQHSVEEGYSFSFSLTPVEGNTDPAPVVTTSRGETIEPRQSDGKYVISGIYENITISFASLPTANEAMTTESIRIRSIPGGVYIQTPEPATTVIYTLSGQFGRKLSLPAGDSRIGLPEGFYIIRIGSLHQKVIIR